MRSIGALPDGWRLFIEHKLYEPAFYSTVLNDWGTSYYCARELGEHAFSLVDLGHHAPNMNVEQDRGDGSSSSASSAASTSTTASTAMTISMRDRSSRSGSFSCSTSWSMPSSSECLGSIRHYMLDQSHNVTDPIESLMTSAVELARAYVQAHLVDREALSAYQTKHDPLMALQTLKQAFNTDVGPILAMARHRAGGAIDPVAVYRASQYRERAGRARPAVIRSGAGIV